MDMKPWGNYRSIIEIIIKNTGNLSNHLKNFFGRFVFEDEVKLNVHIDGSIAKSLYTIALKKWPYKNSKNYSN
jgi:hypothetical protein